MSKQVIIADRASMGVVGLLWALLMFTKLMGLSPMGWVFTLFFPLIWLAGFIVFFAVCACIAYGINWLAKRG